MNSSVEEYRSFNVLGKSFEIRMSDLARYPNTLLSNKNHLEIYWCHNLNVYFLSRDVHVFEDTILPFYTSSSIKKIKYSSKSLLTEKLFKKELDFYDLSEYYQNDNVANVLFENEEQICKIISPFRRLLLIKCVCRCIIESISCVSCLIGICEMIVWKCNDRLIHIIIGDILTSLILLWSLFYEQYSDRIIFKGQLKKFIENKQLKILCSSESIIFIMQIIFSSIPFIISLLSYRNKNVWYYKMSLCLRHFLLIRLCFPEECHFLDIIYSNGRFSFRFYSNLLIFLMSICFLCISIGILINITESQSQRSIKSPSYYVYFVYQIILNIGYGDIKEESILSFIILVSMTLVGCSILIILYQKLIEELDNLKKELTSIETWSHQSFLEDLLRRMKSVSTKQNDENINTSCS